MDVEIPANVDSSDVKCGTKKVSLTNLQKIFWPELKKTKRDLLAYYAGIASTILPHLKNRAMVMKRYPNGIEGEFFFMKRTPAHRPAWIETCSIAHKSGNVIDFPIAQDLASLLWIVNLGCIDLNPWYARCDDVDRPDFLHFDLDPVPPAEFAQVREAALLVRAYLEERNVHSIAKTTGSRGIHIYVAIRRAPLQKDVWRVAKRAALELAKQHPDLLTAEYRVAKRPAGHVLVDYNQNAWGRTLASVYSVRPRPEATVSAPVTWEEIEAGISASALTMDTVPARVRKLGDLFKALLQTRSRCPLEVLG
ncbi:MAG: non-homologous end-joining DNA ligase [Acidobacteriaceae bacterium]|nr:non-homologous end-joining DNA ligase [Acidobacteriaceae bacterium]MBV9782093.1 non-homologous end-joining DNA ligase [Acidobacteriaceae bacterium]